MKTHINISVDIKHEPILQEIQLKDNLKSYTQVVDMLLYEKTKKNEGLPFSKFSITNRRYIGSKAKLLGFISSSIEKNIGEFETFVDIFSGTGSVGNYFNSPKHQIITNDLLYSNYLSNTAFLGNEGFDFEKIDLVLKELIQLSPKRDNYFSKHFGGKFFSEITAKRIGAIRENIQKQKNLNPREKAILITSLLYASDKIANTCGHYDAYREGSVCSDNLILKHLDIFHAKNSNNLNFNEDSNELAKKLSSKKMDIVYADPPYNSRQYGSAYHVLENLARWNKPDVEGKASKMLNRKELNSNYCTKSAIQSFEELVDNVNAKYFILSYSNMEKKGNDRSNAKMDDKDIIRILEKKGDLIIESSSHQAFSAGKSNINNHEERLFICKLK